MRIFLTSFVILALSAGAPAWAQDSEPLTGGSSTQRSARFEISTAQQYVIARARAESLDRAAFLRYNDWMGYDYAHPHVNPGVFTLAQPPMRIRRLYAFPGTMIDYRGYGF